ncbi:golgin subfamily A member 6-like protein 10 [Mytilus trossulus]|uniref:golgin subfamily A member 6-like protein 10 n=1 Tax=Mytilus trossulus TaxID=6551 RepID=UPI003005D089
MASNSQLTEEERNFTRFFLLNFKVSPDIVRRFFDGVFPPAQLAQTVNSASSSKDFDLTLMICLMRNLGGLLTPSNGWDQLPLMNEMIPGADLATLKWYRNQLAHMTITSMDINEFTDKWMRVDKALTALNKGQRPHKVTEILNYDLDGGQAKTLANAELKIMKKEYMECEKEKDQIESVLFICEKEKEQIESVLSICEKEKEQVETVLFICEKEKEQIESVLSNCEKEKEQIESVLSICEKEKEQIESFLSICEKEKEQIESYLSHYKEGNLPKNIADANSSLVETWLKDDKSFYDTKASYFVYDKIHECTCILVASNSGLGKTAIIRHIALKLQSEGFQIVSVEYPADVIK